MKLLQHLDGRIILLLCRAVTHIIKVSEQTALPKGVVAIYQLTSRQQKVLVLLLTHKKPVAVKEIALCHSVSQRTIRYDLEQIAAFLKQQGGTLVKRPGMGVAAELDSARREALLALADEVDSPTRVLSKEERAALILRSLLLSVGPLTIDELANRLLVSRTTVTADLLQVSQLLEQAGLLLVGKKGEGFRVEGRESSLRQLTVNTLEGLIPPHYAVNRNAMTNALLRSIADKPGDAAMAASYLCQVETDRLGELMDAVRELIPYNMHSAEQMRFTLYLAVLVIRSRGGHRVEPCGEQAFIEMDSRENQMAQLLAGRLSVCFHISLSDSEVLLLARWLISCNAKFSPKANDKILLQLAEIVDDMLLALGDFPGYDLPEFYQDKLKMNLISHLKLTIKKYNLQISALNTLLIQMKVNYPEVFAVSYKMAARFEAWTGIALGEDEIGFIAIHIAASIEECSRLRSKRALIVCNTGKGAAMVLYNRICSNIPRLEIVGTISAPDAMESDTLGRIDFIISTIELPEATKPVFRVSPIITPAEMAKISSYINGNLSLEAGTQEVTALVEPHTTVGSYEEAAVLRCAMILAKLGSVAGELEQLYGVRFATDNIFGLSIHLMMSIPRWEKGIYSRESATDRYKEEHIELFRFIAKLLREASKECGINIPDKEALAIMRYFV